MITVVFSPKLFCRDKLWFTTSASGLLLLPTLTPTDWPQFDRRFASTFSVVAEGPEQTPTLNSTLKNCAHLFTQEMLEF